VFQAVLFAAALGLDSMTLRLAVPTRVRVGEPVPVTLSVTNRGATPLTLYLKGRPIAFDIVVRRKGGEIIWRRLHGATIAMVLRVETVPPGDSMQLEDVWPQRTQAGAPVQPGDYTVTGELPTDGPEPLRSAAAPLRIDPVARKPVR
jgi:intracellular proteinase inhibitor BsuPI